MDLIKRSRNDLHFLNQNENKGIGFFQLKFINKILLNIGILLIEILSVYKKVRLNFRKNIHERCV